jgi:hypothetical protein
VRDGEGNGRIEKTREECRRDEKDESREGESMRQHIISKRE